MSVIIPLKSDFQVHCYTAPTATGASSYHEYSALVANLRFSGDAPGGFGQASFLVFVADALLPYPELQVFSRVVIAHGADARWIGEISDSRPVLKNKQYAIQVSALGMGAALRDDPYFATYSNKSLAFIAADQLQARTNPAGTFHPLVGVIDNDASQLFPDNPGGTFGPSYDNKNIEEIFQDLCALGSTNSVVYQFGTEAHPNNKDSFGFPTVRAFIRQRDTTTTHFQASILQGEIEEHDIGQSIQYAYNYVSIDYTTNSTGGVSRAAATDSRLNTNLTQGNAPFRERKLLRDFSGVSTVGSSQANAIASTYLGQFQNLTNKGSVKLRGLRDAQGIPVPLDALIAGKNLFIPELTPRGQSTSYAPVAGVNQFQIVSFEWSEDQEGPAVLCQLDNFVDSTSFLVAKLMLSADVRARSTKSTGQLLGPGVPDTVNGGGSSVATGAAQNVSWAFSWHQQLSNTPTSATTSTISLVNGGSTFVNHLTTTGGNIGCASTASGLVTYLAAITSVGNTLLAVDETAATLDWHCGGCDTKHEQLAIREHLQVHPGHGARAGQPGESGLKIACPGCGFAEFFNTYLAAEDEDRHTYGGHHAEQAQLIRRLMRHPHIGLEVRP